MLRDVDLVSCKYRYADDPMAGWACSVLQPLLPSRYALNSAPTAGRRAAYRVRGTLRPQHCQQRRGTWRVHSGAALRTYAYEHVRVLASTRTSIDSSKCSWDWLDQLTRKSTRTRSPRSALTTQCRQQPIGCQASIPVRVKPSPASDNQVDRSGISVCQEAGNSLTLGHYGMVPPHGLALVLTGRKAAPARVVVGIDGFGGSGRVGGG